MPFASGAPFEVEPFEVEPFVVDCRKVLAVALAPSVLLPRNIVGKVLSPCMP